MNFWHGSGLEQLLFIAALLVAAATLRRLIPPLQRLNLPDSMLAGLFGLALGPSALALLPLDTDFLEGVVYHALALVFISVGLQTPVEGRTSGGAQSLAVGIPLMAVLQGIVGLLMILVWNSTSDDPLHPGFGLMLPLAFSQGPGQALSLGTAWEALGMDSGGQVGLILAAIGFGWCVVVGVPLTLIAKAKGWTTPAAQQVAASRPPEGPPQTSPPGGMETLSLNLVSVGLVYLMTYGVLRLLAWLLTGLPGIAAMIWGFHFIIAGILAMGYRRVLDASGITHRLHDGLLGRVAGSTVDVATTAAIAAIEVAVLRAFLGPIVLFSTVSGVLSLVLILWLGRRAFPQAPFEHALVLFGASTGTMPTALALLRILDPDLRGPVASSAVLAATAAIIFGAPLLLVVIPIAVTGYPGTYPGSVFVSVGILVAYAALLLVGWRFIGPLRVLRPLHHLWPSNDHPER